MISQRQLREGRGGRDLNGICLARLWFDRHSGDRLALRCAARKLPAGISCQHFGNADHSQRIPWFDLRRIAAANGGAPRHLKAVGA